MTKRLAMLALLAITGIAGWRVFLSVGHVLLHEDPLVRADVIYVLGGARVERVAEAAELYKEGWAPKILLSPQISEVAEVQLRERGLQIPSEIDLQKSVLVQMGVPAEAILVLATGQVATSTEAEELYALSHQHDWQRMIVVTSKMHTARARLALRRRFRETNKTIVMRASRYDVSDVDRWWERRATFRFALFEAQKLLAYAVGLE